MEKISVEEFNKQYGEKYAFPVVKEKSFSEKASSALDTAFGGGAIGEAIGSQFAKHSEEGRRLLAMEQQGLVPKGTFEQTFKGPSGKALAWDVAQGVIATGTGGIGGIVGRTLAPVTKGAIQATARTLSSVPDVVRGAADIAKGTVQMGKNIAEDVKLAPERIRTNAATRKAETEAIESLPSSVQKKAVQNGIDINDINVLNAVPKVYSPDVKKLVDSVVKYDNRSSTIDPMTVVGSPIVQTLKKATSEASKVGKELSTIAPKIGNLTPDEMKIGVFNRLTKVPGLQGLKIGEDGLLDFSRTTMSSSITEAERNALQKAFNEAINRTDGTSAHLFRQELFEDLGGKTRAGMKTTATLDQGINAIRGGISDVLSSKDKLYAELSKKYAQLQDPIDDLKRILKASDPTMSDDILNLNAGILARRLTSTSLSQGEILNILQKIGGVTGDKNIADRTKNLQEVYNVLNSYYKIKPKTGYEALTQSATEQALQNRSLSDIAFSGIKNTAGVTDAVRKEALEKAIRDIFK